MSYIEDIQRQIDQQLYTVRELFEVHPAEVCEFRPSEKKWSARECIGHLNKTLGFYLPAIREQIDKSRAKGQKANEKFRPGFLGERMTRMMAPRNGVIRNKVRTSGPFLPAADSLQQSRATLVNFESLMGEFRELVAEAGEVDLGKTRVPTPFKIIRLKLGDAFPFVLAHSERHILQAQLAVESAPDAS